MANPATILTQVLGRLFDRDRRVTIPGFYDQVRLLRDVDFLRVHRLADRIEPLRVPLPLDDLSHLSGERDLLGR